ncbi:MAG: hypothetical protein J6P21_04435 [Clostridia bacterium]|nr:hypothetical protein [Clostridia bacterium]
MSSSVKKKLSIGLLSFLLSNNYLNLSAMESKKTSIVKNKIMFGPGCSISGRNFVLGERELEHVVLSANLEKKRFQLEVKDIYGNVVNIDKDSKGADLTLETVRTKIKEFEGDYEIKEIIVNISSKDPKKMAMENEEKVVRAFRDSYGTMSYLDVNNISGGPIRVLEKGKLKTVKNGANGALVKLEVGKDGWPTILEVEKFEITFKNAMKILVKKYQDADAEKFEKEFKSFTKNDALKQKIALGKIGWEYFSNNLEKKRFQIEVLYNNGDVRKYPDNLKSYWLLDIADARTIGHDLGTAKVKSLVLHGGCDLETVKAKIRELEPETNKIKEIKVHIPELGPELFEDSWEWK